MAIIVEFRDGFIVAKEAFKQEERTAALAIGKLITQMEKAVPPKAKQKRWPGRNIRFDGPFVDTGIMMKG